MPETVRCATHGERQQVFVCTHLAGDAVSLGFNSDEPTEANPFPDAWCDNCELIRASHGSWNDEAQALAKISLLCSGCYQRTRIRNTRPELTLDDLATLRWKCDSCDEWHTGPCLDFSYDEPYYWRKEYKTVNGAPGRRQRTFLTGDYCAIDDEHFFVRGFIPLPIVGTNETFNWGVWGSLSRENFDTVLEMDDNPKAAELPPMFSWLSSKIAEYPETLSLKMYAHMQPGNQRPWFELEPSPHPLAQEYKSGILPEKIRQIMMCRLPRNE